MFCIVLVGMLSELFWFLVIIIVEIGELVGGSDVFIGVVWIIVMLFCCCILVVVLVMVVVKLFFGMLIFSFMLGMICVVSVGGVVNISLFIDGLVMLVIVLLVVIILFGVICMLLMMLVIGLVMCMWLFVLGVLLVVVWVCVVVVWVCVVSDCVCEVFIFWWVIMFWLISVLLWL